MFREGARIGEPTPKLEHEELLGYEVASGKTVGQLLEKIGAKPGDKLDWEAFKKASSELGLDESETKAAWQEYHRYVEKNSWKIRQEANRAEAKEQGERNMVGLREFVAEIGGELEEGVTLPEGFGDLTDGHGMMGVLHAPGTYLTVRYDGRIAYLHESAGGNYFAGDMFTEGKGGTPERYLGGNHDFTLSEAKDWIRNGR